MASVAFTWYTILSVLTLQLSNFSIIQCDTTYVQKPLLLVSPWQRNTKRLVGLPPLYGGLDSGQHRRLLRAVHTPGGGSYLYILIFMSLAVQLLLEFEVKPLK